MRNLSDREYPRIASVVVAITVRLGIALVENGPASPTSSWPECRRTDGVETYLGTYPQVPDYTADHLIR